MRWNRFVLALPCAALFLQSCGSDATETYFDNGALKERWHETKNADGVLVKNGVYERFDEKGTRRDSTFYDMGKISGIRMTWDSQGKLETRSEWVSGKNNGTYQEWDGNGKLRHEIHFKQGIQDGSETTWNKKGIKIEEVFFKDGRKDSVYQRWNDEGLLKQISHYTLGKLNGEEKIWCEEEKYKDVIREQRTFVMGKREGLEVYYLCLDGSKSSMLTWKNDQMDGPYTYWEEGKKVVERYKEGKCVANCPKPPPPPPQE
ncbi:MAG TPA: hypothetical protein VLM37_03885 [Fibrobacteraceae bacterium]|nr:hypothetical protein [Fibrobacteraceae bacterium]